MFVPSGELDANEGMEHAKAIARRISRSGSDAPGFVYSSPFVRTTHTAQLIALDLPGASVRIEEGLTEWQIPSLLVDGNGVRTFPKKTDQLAAVYGTIDLSYTSLNPAVSDDAAEVPNGAPKYEESEDALLERCAMTLSRILEHSNGASFVVVSHAPCDQALALDLEGKGATKSNLGPWPLGGITKFSRNVDEKGGYDEWEMELYGDTQHMPGKYKAGLKVCSRFMLPGAVLLLSLFPCENLFVRVKEWSLPCLSGRKVERHAFFD
jgi:broad specificity phosphatase PhoE